ncbi:hypothetical protein C7R34_13555 [Staphylococcus aureus]|nr:hypothetical protein C7R34_13555 [Staphylococcus aureus]
MSTLGFIDINKAPFKVFIFSMSTLKGAFHFVAVLWISKHCRYRRIVEVRIILALWISRHC